MPSPDPPGERLQKVLAAAGVASRRRCEELITAGRVTVNQRRVTALGTRVDPHRDVIAVDGKPLVWAPRLEYWALRKPRGVLSAAADTRGRVTVVDLVKRAGQRVLPIGRLDLDAEGLILLTNDGELMHRMLHPRFGVEKEYRVLVRGVPDPAGLDALRRGTLVEGRWARPRSVDVEGPDRASKAPQTWLRMVLTEGRKREVKVLCAAAGYPVVRLVRVRFGPVHLGRLHPGESRPLTAPEVQALRRLAGLA